MPALLFLGVRRAGVLEGLQGTKRFAVQSPPQFGVGYWVIGVFNLPSRRSGR